MQHHPLEQLYKGGLWIKGLNGVLELIGAGLVVIAPRSLGHRIMVRLAERAKDQRGGDRVYGALARGFDRLAGHGRGFAIFYLASHGIVKIILAVLLFQHVRAAYPIGITIFIVLIGYEVYRLIVKPGILISGIVLLDSAILTLILLHGPAGGG